MVTYFILQYYFSKSFTIQYYTALLTIRHLAIVSWLSKWTQLGFQSI